MFHPWGEEAVARVEAYSALVLEAAAERATIRWKEEW